MSNRNYLTLEEAAEEIGMTISWVKELIGQGKLSAKLERRNWLVSIESLRKITTPTPPSKPDTKVHNFLIPLPTPEAQAGEKPAKKDRHSQKATPASISIKVNAAQVSPRRGDVGAPEPNRRVAIEKRIEALDRKIAKFGDLLRKEMLARQPVDDSRGPEVYGKTAIKLLRQWNIARETREKLAIVLQNLDEKGRVTISAPSPKARGEKSGKVPIQGIPGYRAGSGDADSREDRRLPASVEARLMILRSRERAAARSMQDRGTSRAARDAAGAAWAQARREAEKLESELRTYPLRTKEALNDDTTSTSRQVASKIMDKTSARSRLTTPSQQTSASSTNVARSASKGKQRKPAPNRRDRLLHDISHISDRIKKSGHPAPFGDPTLGFILVVEQPVNSRVVEALKLSLEVVRLSQAYSTFASTGLLKEELLVIKPQFLVAVGAGGARDIDNTNYPFVRRPFSTAEPGVWFGWTRNTRGLLLPSLLSALDDDTAKRRFWQAFLKLKIYAPTR